MNSATGLIYADKHPEYFYRYAHLIAIIPETALIMGFEVTRQEVWIPEMELPRAGLS